jgi:hypothetical protein
MGTVPEAGMSDSNAAKPFGRAILSLLVAADQRCPAIIGQAHLLYHGRLRATSEETAQTFAQLKRDADDLCRAIATVEAAIAANNRGTPLPIYREQPGNPPRVQDDAC